jgi:hypothetical protein
MAILLRHPFRFSLLIAEDCYGEEITCLALYTACREYLSNDLATESLLVNDSEWIPSVNVLVKCARRTGH